MSAIEVNDQYPFEFETVQVDEHGNVIERKPGRAFAFRESLTDEIELEMVAIPGGEFIMGSPESEYNRSEDETPQHLVTIQPFFMGKYPVTEAQWHAIADTLPVERNLDLNSGGLLEEDLPVEEMYWGKATNLPVTGMFWDQAIEFCHRLSRDTGRNYRLPTEAEWEYACRAGTETPFSFGQTITTDLANYRGTDCGNVDEQWFLSGSYDRGPKGIFRDDITPIDAFPPNAFGLYDMHGNVSEWCLDPWHGNYRGAPADGSAWISGGDDNVVIRGGSFNTFPAHCRSASRHLQTLERYSRYCTKGFRVVCEISKTP
jgi:formylglycine-generating enzyme required for sulfatase activity